jgi:malonyl-CoA/methylmalonyl-CoA synthetase
MNIIESFRATFENSVNRTGLEFSDDELTFQKLDVRSNRLARRFSEDGLIVGDRVIVYLGNSPEFIVAYLAILKAGLVFVPVNILYREREVQQIIDDSEPRAAVASSDLIGCLESCFQMERGKIGPRVLLYRANDFDELSHNFLTESVVCPCQMDNPAMIVYTSGTTGTPKGAMLSHRNLIANTETLLEAWRITGEDRLLLALPLFHVHGLGNGLHTWLATGLRLRLLERFRHESIAEEFQRFRPTVFFGVPTIYERLLSVEPKMAQEIGDSMRLFVSGSAPLPASTLEGFRSLYGHDILERYGMSETLMNISNPYEGERRPGSVGKPLRGVLIRLVNPKTGEQVETGEIGEVLIRGDNVFSGYHQRPKANAAAFTEDGFFRSGDLAMCSDDGYYTLVGRRDDLIISGGFNVYPRQIEELLTEQSGVAEVAIVGEPDPSRGEVLAAYVKLQKDSDLNGQKLRDICRENLASFKIPRKFIFVEKLPRNALGKLQRHKLSKASSGLPDSSNKTD